MTNTRQIYIGIDPAKRAYGFAICILSDRSVIFERYKNPIDAAFYLLQLANETQKGMIVAIEDSSKINATYRLEGNKNVAARKSRNAGMNQAVSAIFTDWLVILLGKEKVYAIAPNKKGTVVKNPKIFAQMLREDGYTDIKSEKKIVEDDMVAYHMARIAKRRHSLITTNNA